MNTKMQDFANSIDEMIASPDEMKAAIEIEESINRKKTGLIRQIFEEIIDEAEKSLGLSPDSKLNNLSENEGKIDKYYHVLIYPNLNYNMGLIKKTEDGVEYYFVLRYEMNWKPSVGFVIMSRDADGILSDVDKPSTQLMESARSLLVDRALLSTRMRAWLYWEHIVAKSQKISDEDPDFDHYNDAYFSLYEESARKLYVKQVVDSFSKFKDYLK